MTEDKQNQSKIVSDKIIERLETMTELAKNLPQPAEIQSLAKKDQYIRIGGNGFKAISLHCKKPLKGHSNNPVKKLDTVYSHFENEIADHPKFPEQRLQAWLIREALMNNRNLKLPFNLNNNDFDELIFALDEVSIGGKGFSVNYLQLSPPLENAKDAVRCDVLAVGRKGSEVFPVVIELKIGREEERLQDQLENFAKLIFFFKEQFRNLLNEIIKNTGLELSEITEGKIRKIMVWPTSTSGKVKTDPSIHNKNDIGLLVYHPEKLRESYPPVDSFNAHLTK